MPSSAEDARDAVIGVLVALERSCLDADAAFVERRWPDVDAAFGCQAELTAELARLFAAAPETAPERDPKVAQRVRGILNYRAEQLSRFEAYHASVGSRLDSIGKLNALSRSMGKREPAARLLDGQY